MPNENRNRLSEAITGDRLITETDGRIGIGATNAGSLLAGSRTVAVTV
jgi:hypothetical protein